MPAFRVSCLRRKPQTAAGAAQMDLNSILDFLAVTDSRSFSKAADLRHVTQPAFSRRIQGLEQELGVILINRDTAPISLTKAGERFLVYAKSLRETMSRAYEDIQSQTTDVADPVHIVMPHSLSVTFFPGWYRAMQRRQRGLQMRLTHQRSSKCIMDLHSQLADLAIILYSPDVPTCYDLSGLLSHEIGTERLIAVRAGHAKDSSQQVLSHRPGSYLYACSQHLLKRHKAGQLPVVFESSSSHLLKSMTLSGFGIAALQESLIEDELRDGYLTKAFPKSRPLDCQLLLLRPQTPISPKAETLWKNLQK